MLGPWAHYFEMILIVVCTFQRMEETLGLSPYLSVIQQGSSTWPYTRLMGKLLMQRHGNALEDRNTDLMGVKPRVCSEPLMVEILGKNSLTAYLRQPAKRGGLAWSLPLQIPKCCTPAMPMPLGAFRGYIAVTMVAIHGLP